MAGSENIGELIVKLLIESNADTTLGNVSKTSAEAEKRLAQLVSTAKSFSIQMKNGVPVIDIQNEKLTEHNKALDEGSKSYRQFFREQRLQDRIAREASQAVTSVAFAVAFLAERQGEGNEEAKRYATAMLAGVAGMNAMEFSAFALGKSLVQLGGTMGKVGNSLMRMAGPIGFTIGAVSALLAFITSANEEGKKTDTEGIGLFINKLKSFSGKDLSLLKDALALMKKLNEEATAPPQALSMIPSASAQGPLRALFAFTQGTAQSPVAPMLGIERTQDEDRNRIIDEIEKEIKKQGVLNEFEEKANSLIRQRANRLQLITLELSEINESIKKGITTDAEGVNLIEKRVKLVQEFGELTMTNQEREARNTRLAQLSYEMKKISVEDLIKQLEIEAKATSTAEDRAKIEARIYALKKEQADVEIRLQEIRERSNREQLEKQREAENFLLDNLDAQRLAMIEKEADRKRELERQRHEKEVADIFEATAITLDMAERERQTNEANRIHDRNMKKIDHEEDLANINQLADTIGIVGNALHQAFGQAGGDFLSKMLSALQIAMQIEKTIALMNAGTLTGASGPLGIVSSLLGLFGLFDKGGYTGPGGRYQPAGIVHRGEIVFEKPLVDRHGADLMALRSSLKQGYADGGITGGSIGISRSMGSRGMAGDNSRLIREIRVMRESLARSIREMEVKFPERVKTDISNGDLFLRQSDEGLQKWKRKKEIR